MPTPVQLGIITAYPKKIRPGASGWVTAQASAGVITLTVPNTIQGQGLVIGIVSYDASATISSVVCTGETVTAVGSLFRAGAGVLSDAAIIGYYIQNLQSGGPKTITITLSASVTAVGGVLPVSGQDQNNFFDANTTAAAGSVTITTAQREEMVCFIGVSGGAQTPNGPYIQSHFVTPLQRNEFYHNFDIGSAGTYTAAFSGTGNNLIYAMSFKAAL